MAINYYEVMGEMTIKQKQYKNYNTDSQEMIERKFKIGIWTANCIACFNYTYHDKERGCWVDQLYTFFNDKSHVERISQSYKDGRLFPDDVVNIKLNLYYKSAEPLLRLLVKHGYKVKCYYKEPKKNKK